MVWNCKLVLASNINFIKNNFAIESSFFDINTRRGLRPFFLGCKIGGVRIWQGVEIFPQHAVFIAHHAVFIAQQMLDQIYKSFLKSGFSGHI